MDRAYLPFKRLSIAEYGSVWYEKQRRGDQRLSYKQCIKGDLKAMRIDAINQGQLVVGRPAWRRPLHIRAATIEASRLALMKHFGIYTHKLQGYKDITKVCSDLICATLCISRQKTMSLTPNSLPVQNPCQQQRDSDGPGMSTVWTNFYCRIEHCMVREATEKRKKTWVQRLNQEGLERSMQIT